MKTFHFSKSHLITILILSFLNSIQAQVVEPTETSTTVSIVPGSSSLISVPKPTSVDLTRDFISGIPSPTPTSSNQPQEIVFITGCSTCNSVTSSILPTVNSTKESNSNQLSSTDLGAIIGGCAGGLVVITIVTIWLCIRRRRTKERRNAQFDIGPIQNRSSIHYNTNTGLNHHHQLASGQSLTQNDGLTKEPKPIYNYNNDRNNDKKKVYAIDNNDSTIKRYNVSVGSDTPDNQMSMTPPVILYTDAHNNQQQREEKYLVEEENETIVRPRIRTVSQASKEVRLSKYNFLSQAFSQMRNSYGGDVAMSQQSNYTTHTNSNDNSFKDQPISMIAAPQPTKADRSYRDSMVLPHHNNKDISTSTANNNYSMYTTTDSNLDVNRTSPPAPARSTTSFFHDPTRESTITVGTLHAPLFHQQMNRKQPYLSRLNVTPTFDRDSVKSDEVSKYSTSPTTTSPTSNSHANNKPYPYF